MQSVLIGLAAISLVSCSSAHMATHGDGNAPLTQEVRRATERYQDVTAATAAGYALFLGCVSSPQGGAMGIHYVNGDLVGDGEAGRLTAGGRYMYEPKGRQDGAGGRRVHRHRGRLGRGRTRLRRP